MFIRCNHHFLLKNAFGIGDRSVNIRTKIFDTFSQWWRTRRRSTIEFQKVKRQLNVFSLLSLIFSSCLQIWRSWFRSTTLKTTDKRIIFFSFLFFKFLFFKQICLLPVFLLFSKCTFSSCFFSLLLGEIFRWKFFFWFYDERQREKTTH